MKMDAQSEICVGFEGENRDLFMVCREFFEGRVGRHMEEAGEQVCCGGLLPGPLPQLLWVRE